MLDKMKVQQCILLLLEGSGDGAKEQQTQSETRTRTTDVTVYRQLIWCNVSAMSAEDRG